MPVFIALSKVTSIEKASPGVATSDAGKPTVSDLWTQATREIEPCDRCDDWSAMGLSNTCPRCDAAILQRFGELQQQAKER